MRKAHRYIAVFAAFIGLFLACTGLLVQSMDLRTLLTHAPATDPTFKSIHAGLDGPPNFKVIRTLDYVAAPLPTAFDFNTALPIAAKSARAAIGAGPIGFLEWRMRDGRPVAQAASGKTLYTFDAISGARLGAPGKVVFEPNSSPSLRGTIKDVHRLRWFGGWAVAVDVLFGLVMCAMVVTGFVQYYRLLKTRRRMNRKALFWKAGGWWRTLHRGTSVVAALFLTVIAVSGTILAISSLGVVVNEAIDGGRPGLTVDASKPLRDAELPAMLHRTLATYRAIEPEAPLKVMRLRYFAGTPQGVVVSGGAVTEQHAFDTTTGREVNFWEPGYPATGQTFGWQVDETVKMIHRGDYFGLTGRWMSLLSGLALLYLVLSGAALYLDQWRVRRSRGRHGLFWS